VKNILSVYYIKFTPSPCFQLLTYKEYCPHYILHLHTNLHYTETYVQMLCTLQVLLYLPQNNPTVNQMQELFQRHKFACSPHCGTGCRKFRNRIVRWVQTGKFPLKNLHVMSSSSELEMRGGRGHAHSMLISRPVALQKGKSRLKQNNINIMACKYK